MFSLTLYRDGTSDKQRPGRPHTRQGLTPQMKTTMTFRSTANPRRTTLAHLKDTEALLSAERPEHSVALPNRTANPRRTILMDVPADR